jgi:hypothetical protein
MSRLDEIAQELTDLHTIISNWCIRMAWPGGVPIPPFAAWERRSELYNELRNLGVQNPKYFTTHSVREKRNGRLHHH